MLKMSKDKLLIFEDIPWDILKKYCHEKIPNEIKVHLEPIVNVLELSTKKNEGIPEDWVENTLVRLEACVDRTWEALNTGHWRDVPMQQRYCYTICSFVKCMLLEIDWKNHENKDKKKTGGDKMRVIVEQVDKGLLLGAPLDDAPDLLTQLATRLNKHFANKIQSSDTSFLKNNEDNFEKKLLPGLSWLKRHKVPSMETFYREIFVAKLPAVLEDCMQHWTALELWKDPKYLVKVAGVRTVPVEIGSRYTEDDWSQHLLTLADFIDSHLNKSSDKIGYLAQHQLFDQIPELKDDFSIPDYCSFSDGPEPTSPDINAWFGPKGTVSPLHFDPKNNLLCQVFGFKQVILYPPSETEYLYPFDTRLLTNTAQADPQNPDYKKFPKFKNAQGSMCFLGPGEMVFIPPGWWHHVVSMSPSFSISFWWT